jgi:nitrate reductase NapD
MVISSLVVETLPDSTPAVSQALSSIEGVEVHGLNDNQVVVTIEAETTDDSHTIASSFIKIEGVLGINLVYANFEDDPSLKGHYR